MDEFNIKVLELELKFKADEVSLTKFQKFAESLNPKKTLYVASDDTYYSPKSTGYSGAAEFIRFRQGGEPQLTTKQKKNSQNNNSRIEVDLLLSKKQIKSEMDIWMESIGFEENFTIYKKCHIYFYDKIDIVYYTVMNKEDGYAIGSFIEVEARKDAKFSSEEEAWTLVKEMEAKLSIFDITPQNRLKKSMWEIFRRDASK